MQADGEIIVIGASMRDSSMKAMTSLGCCIAVALIATSAITFAQTSNYTPIIVPVQPNTTYQTIGSTVFGSNGNTYQNIGNTTFGSDGTTYQSIGNTTFGSDGTTYQPIGNTTFGSDGTTSTTIGNTTFGSNGTTCNTIGETVFCY